jgi:hypothetical protein
MFVYICFLYFHLNVNTLTTAYDARLIKQQPYTLGFPSAHRVCKWGPGAFPLGWEPLVTGLCGSMFLLQPFPFGWEPLVTGLCGSVFSLWPFLFSLGFGGPNHS